jgi:predicted lipoprotein with Yx(FWY)xxD motif
VQTWLPATASSASGLPAHVATVKRDDGALQLTYDGHPLYRYAGDTSVADAKGEGVGGQWFVVKAGSGGGASGSGATSENNKGSYGY